ncbi:hypothetical protein F7725_012085 [Dissostichus mawsoni]|uniref:Transposase Helix-turn-helix domain-containing protein n=1 Tax=Dissostichus mawsoni TaxID=36200 RepID=A0A7J5ZAQ8_DISMA|nr:hypothetical protein F7725_012085 [Dissostichus mawsoni]
MEPGDNTPRARMSGFGKFGKVKERRLAFQRKLPPIDELLLFLMHLSVGLHLRDLAEQFGIHCTTVELTSGTSTLIAMVVISDAMSAEKSLYTSLTLRTSGSGSSPRTAL